LLLVLLTVLLVLLTVLLVALIWFSRGWAARRTAPALRLCGSATRCFWPAAIEAERGTEAPRPLFSCGRFAQFVHRTTETDQPRSMSVTRDR
jgi:hypothetical protein